eukprot:5316203-Lingulodinium_polyedra.AAC.1
MPLNGGGVALNLARGRNPMGAVRRPHGRLALGSLCEQGLASSHGPRHAGTPRVVPLRVLAAVLRGGPSEHAGGPAPTLRALRQPAVLPDG